MQVTYSTTMDNGRGSMPLSCGRYEVTASFDAILLPREYTIDLGIHRRDGTTADFVQRTYDFRVLRVAESGNGHYPWPKTRGFVGTPARWDFEHCSDEERQATQA